MLRENARDCGIAGFSLIEVNMAIFVMAIGILSMVVLYPLGMRESRQGQDDLQQSMMADHILNKYVAALSRPEITWASWRSVKLPYEKPTRSSIALKTSDYEAKSSLASLVSGVTMNLPSEDDSKYPHLRHKVYAHRVAGTSGKIIGIQVDFLRRVGLKELVNQSYYAEAMFQGKP